MPAIYRNAKQSQVASSYAIVTVTTPAPTPSQTTPTATPAPAVSAEGVGSASHADDAAFCAAHQCIGAFTTEPGTIVQCADGTE